VTVYFWVTKVLTTALGEATSDYLVVRLGSVPAVLIGFVFFAAALALQFWVRRYVPWIYWLAAAMVAVFGTMAADVLHIRFKIPYLTSVVFFAIVLALCFAIWHGFEKTLSIHSISTPRREVFYWATIVTTFALGTALGDYTAVTLHLGYFSSGLLFAALIAVPALAYRFFHINGILAFWACYVLTRPLGASFADWGGKAHSVGGLGLGDAIVAFGLAVAIIALVGYQSAVPSAAGDAASR
jgi:uncharacterized membrane-anchored protein